MKEKGRVMGEKSKERNDSKTIREGRKFKQEGDGRGRGRTGGVGLRQAHHSKSCTAESFLRQAWLKCCQFHSYSLRQTLLSFVN